MLYPDEDDESVGSETDPKLLESLRLTPSSPKLISATVDDSADVPGLYGVGVPGENAVEHPAVFRSQYGENGKPVSSVSRGVVRPVCFLGSPVVRNNPSGKNRFAGEGEGSGDASGEGRGVRRGDFGTFGNRESLSANLPPPCSEALRGTSRIFPSSTWNSQGQSLSLPLTVGRYELAVLSPEMEVPDCA